MTKDKLSNWKQIIRPCTYQFKRNQSFLFQLQTYNTVYNSTTYIRTTNNEQWTMATNELDLNIDWMIFQELLDSQQRLRIVLFLVIPF